MCSSVLQWAVLCVVESSSGSVVSPLSWTLLSDQSTGLFPHVLMLLGGHVLAPQAVATLLQTVGLPGLDPLLLQDLRVIQDLQAWNLTDDILPVEAALTLLNQIPTVR